jgi:hypothetical protein
MKSSKKIITYESMFSKVCAEATLCATGIGASVPSSKKVSTIISASDARNRQSIAAAGLLDAVCSAAPTQHRRLSTAAREILLFLLF